MHVPFKAYNVPFGLFILVWCVSSLPEERSLIWSCMWFSHRAKSISVLRSWGASEGGQHSAAQTPVGAVTGLWIPCHPGKVLTSSLCFQYNLEECSKSQPECGRERRGARPFSPPIGISRDSDILTC